MLPHSRQNRTTTKEIQSIQSKYSSTWIICDVCFVHFNIKRTHYTRNIYWTIEQIKPNSILVFSNSIRTDIRARATYKTRKIRLYEEERNCWLMKKPVAFKFINMRITNLNALWALNIISGGRAKRVRSKYFSFLLLFLVWLQLFFCWLFLFTVIRISICWPWQWAWKSHFGKAKYTNTPG